jgi:hypothetical protein
MKQVQDKDGNIIEVPIDAPCHAGRDGALPILLDEVKDADVFAEMARCEEEYNAGSIRRRAINKIRYLEAQVSQRRLREAILGTDNGWLAAQENLIKIERNKLGE